jgi:hypothetical protein
MSDMSSIIKPMVCDPDFEIACREKAYDGFNKPIHYTPTNEPEQSVMRRILREKKTYALS